MGTTRTRVVVRGVTPEVECGRFPAKRVVGERVRVEADVFTDGHDLVTGVVRHRAPGREWSEVRLEALVNDRWVASFRVTDVGRHTYTVVGWVDHFGSWRDGLRKKVAAGVDVGVDLLIGADLLDGAASNAPRAANKRLRAAAATLRGGGPLAEQAKVALDPALEQLVWTHAERRDPATYERELAIDVDPRYAGFSAWYELFPRSLGGPDRHGTLRDVIAHLDHVEQLGFDVLYLPPIHPIGRTRRKGRNNAEVGAAGDVGSPWAIGAAEGGHKAVHPDLGTLADVRLLADAARARGIELALDIAFQCSPDHPYLEAHPEWFRARPDGTIQYAENPPKKYQDIYPFDFETESWTELWDELLSVFTFWIEQGVRVFRVDNPHTKPFAFWEWAIGRLKAEHPDVIFLSEAFTRPKVMQRLAKLGFSQSYTYFAWRNEKWELEEYFTELTQSELVEFLRPNVWPNTPDILTEFLQSGVRSAFALRVVLAATLSANYGVYGPAFELLEHVPREPGSEEYRDSEKYELRAWDLDRPDSLAPLLATLNRIRRDNPALQSDRSLRFHPVDNDQLCCYTKSSDDGTNVVLVVVNLDPIWTHSGWLHLDLAGLGIEPGQPFEVHDQLAGVTYLWDSERAFVQLSPDQVAHVFVVDQPAAAPPVPA